MNTATKMVLSLALISTMAQAQTTVNGVVIAKTDVDKELMIATQGRFNQVPADKQAELRKQMLEQLIAKELVYDDAKKIGITNSKEYKDKYEEVTSKIKKEIAIQIWQRQVMDKIALSDAEIKAYYDNNAEEFDEKSAEVRHILVATEGEAKELAKELKGLSGAPLVDKFAALAKSKSSCPSSADGGKLPKFAPKEMVPEFSKEAFSMREKSVSDPVKTQFGYHLIYLDSRVNKKITLAEAKPTISNRLKMEKAKSIMLAKMKELQKKATIVNK